MIFVGTVLLAGCPSKQPEAPKAVADDSPLRVRIAQAEVRRDIAELTSLATSTDAHTRELALRGLGRSGDAKGYEVLEAALGDPDPRVVASAAAAIGLAASLDDKPLSSAALVTALSTARDERTKAALIEAIGRAGEESAQEVLVAQMPSEAAALALGRFGRRKIKLSPAAETSLIEATKHIDTNVRYAATYALARQHEPDDAAVPVLVERLKDDNAETRAQAIIGIAKRKAIATARSQLVQALTDRDWRVGVEAVRALAGPNGDEEGQTAVQSMLARRGGPVVVHRGPGAGPNFGRDHNASLSPDEAVVIEALRVLLTTGKGIAVNPPSGWMQCLAIASSAPPTAAQVDAIAQCTLPDHLKLPLLVELFDKGDAAYRRASLRLLLSNDDPRVRAAGIGALPKTWADGDDKAKATIVGTISSALAVKNSIVAGTAVDAADALYDAMGDTNPLKPVLDAAIIQRATIESDVELAGSLYALIGKRKLANGAEACRSGVDTAPASAKAAIECLRELGEAVDAKPRIAPPPPVDVTAVIGKHVVWHLVTSRGDIDIELRPDVAPWAVATIASLTQRGFYNNIEFHRVVPNFVVQGGDPTQSGWGGPGFTGPAEPASGLDGPGFVQGGVGMADAGRDSAGSQWFIMHSRAPHLDGRYTWVGSVISGQNVADSLQIGDRVVTAKVTIETSAK
jgi:cyclophilin family peptidyl-prolyl cis-trans isomerase/HEAT repeat protein